MGDVGGEKQANQFKNFNQLMNEPDLAQTIHSDRNRSERLWGGGGRSTAPGAYTFVCEEREHRPTPPQSRA